MHLKQGIDNVDIVLDPPCGVPYSLVWSGGSLNGYTNDTATVYPQTTTTYTASYSNGNFICSDNITINVECLNGCTDSTAINYDPLATIDDGVVLIINN